MIADWNRKLAKGDSLRPIDPDKLRYVEACLEFMRSIDERGRRRAAAGERQ